MRLQPSPNPVAIEGSRVRVVFGAGMLGELGRLAAGLLGTGGTRFVGSADHDEARPSKALGGGDRPRRGSPIAPDRVWGPGSVALLVTDPGIEQAGHALRAVASLEAAGLSAEVFDGVGPNPTSEQASAGAEFACGRGIGLIVGLGGGSAMDAAKGINFILTNGGTMADYRGFGRATRPMLPMIAAPTTAGTGSEAQSYALISDPATHRKMACGDPKAQPRIAILDPELTATAPPAVAAAAGIDAIAHAVESSASTRATGVSRRLSSWAWELLSGAWEKAMGRSSDAGTPGRRDGRATLRRGRIRHPVRSRAEDVPARGHPASSISPLSDMLLGAHLAGAAIENSMLGAAHALANPLTAGFDAPHGQAVGLVLPHVVRFNAADGSNPYADLDADADRLAERLTRFLDAAALPRRLRDLGVDESALPALAEQAAEQWTATFNPRPVGPDELLALLRAAW